MNEKEFYLYLGVKLVDRIRVKFSKERGVILNLVLQYEAFLEENWRAIVRYDCAHGFFHRDILKPNGDQEKKIFEMPDLNTAFSFARQDLEDRWEWYKEQYLKNMKK